jgi:predicted MFS family arabinose efflux permease
VLNLVAIAGYGLGTWAINPPQQRRLLSADDRGALLVSLNASALYAGTALGGVTGALVLTGTGSAATLCWTASAIVLAAVIPVVAAARRG